MMKYLLGLLMALAISVPASALGTGTNRVFKDSAGNSLTLLVEACTLDFLSPEMRSQLYAARLMLDGQLLKACYMERNGAILVIDQDQDTYGPFPEAMFTPVKEA